VIASNRRNRASAGSRRGGAGSPGSRSESSGRIWRDSAFGHPCPSDLHPRPEARRAVLLPGTTPQDLPAIRLRLVRHLAGKPALADARLAGDQHELALPAERAVEGGAQPGSLGVAADEGHLVWMLGALGHRRRRGGEVGMDKRVHVLGSRQPLQVMRTDIEQSGPVRQLVGDQLGGGSGEQDLATSAQRSQPGRPVERLPVVVAVAQLGLAGVQRGLGREGDIARPALGGQPSLKGNGGSRGVACPHKHRQRRVALPLSLDELPAMGGDSLGDERLVAGQGGPHGRLVLFPQGRGTFDVGQQEGQDAFWEPGRRPASASLAVRILGLATHHGTPSRGSSRNFPPSATTWEC
jgi:hypothetical protein